MKKTALLLISSFLIFSTSCNRTPSTNSLPESTFSEVKTESEPSPSSNQKNITTEVAIPQDTDSVLSEAEKKQLQEEKKPYESPNDKTKSQNNDDQIMSEAIAKKDVKKCEEISDPDLEKTCINNVNDITSSTTTVN